MQATCLATLRKVEGRSTFLATRNATIAVAKWGVTRELFLATRNTFVALQVARKIASCNMAFTCNSMETYLYCGAQECDGFDGMKESRVLWLGNTDKILGVGFSKVRK